MKFLEAIEVLKGVAHADYRLSGEEGPGGRHRHSDLKTYMYKPTDEDDGYGYHATDHSKIPSIAKRGLVPHKPSADQHQWNDASKGKRVYFFDKKGKDVGVYGDSDTSGRMLTRFKKEKRTAIGKHEGGFGGAPHKYSTQRINPKHVEVLHDTGEWKPIRESVGTVGSPRRPTLAIKKSFGHPKNLSSALLDQHGRIEKEEDYVYHGTHTGNVAKIAKEGLKPQKPGTSFPSQKRRGWEDRKKDPRLFFSRGTHPTAHYANSAYNIIPKKGEDKEVAPVALRFRHPNLRNKEHKTSALDKYTSEQYMDDKNESPDLAPHPDHQYTKLKVHPRHIEALHEDGTWKPLRSVLKEHQDKKQK
jgi:hypothetical protein